MAISKSASQKHEAETTRASLELLYNISRELTTALDLRTVLQRVVFLSMRNVGAISGSIIVLDDNGKPVESAIITGETVHDHTTQRLRITLEKGLAGWVVRNRQAVLIADTSRDERWLPRQYEAEEHTGPRSAVSAPLLLHDRLVGVMTLVHHTAGFFTPEHLALVQAIADQASIAVLNARLYADSQRQARVMTALAESAATITGSLKLEDVLLRILEKITQALRVQAVSLALIDIENGELEFRAATGWQRNEDFYNHLKLGRGITGWVALEGRGVVVPEALKDARFDPEINLRTGLEVRAVTCAPIRYRGEVIGVLEAINPLEKFFDPDALLVLTGIGSLAGSAIHHAQLYENLQVAHQRYRELFDDSVDPILITDHEGSILEANRQAIKLSAFDGDTLLHMNIRQLHTIDQEQTGENFESLSTGSTFSYESQLRPDGQHNIPIQVHVRQVKTEGEPHIQWILRDITEHKNLDNLRDDLISMIYHDLRSPLANVVSSLDMLDNLLVEAEDPALRSLVAIATRSTERIQRLTSSLLDINRLEAGQMVGDRHPASVTALVDEAVDVVQALAENKNQTIVLSIPAQMPPVLVDDDMIRRVLTNLLENAIKFSTLPGKIEVGGKQDGDWGHLWVQDCGPGIPVSEHERIFEKFARLEGTDLPKGFGLGLAYCRLAVQAHGGRIWVESEPGQGARFTFTLPVVPGISFQAEEAPPAEISGNEPAVEPENP
jgi:two-component system, NtrC family, sensor histidine kinase KinB